LIALITLRVPLMYFCVGQGTATISGVAVTCPMDMPAMLEMIRSDANRYVVPLMPFAALGLRGLLANVLSTLRRNQ
jgi:hypothetical protein